MDFIIVQLSIGLLSSIYIKHSTLNLYGVYVYKYN